MKVALPIKYSDDEYRTPEVEVLIKHLSEPYKPKISNFYAEKRVRAPIGLKHIFISTELLFVLFLFGFFLPPIFSVINLIRNCKDQI